MLFTLLEKITGLAMIGSSLANVTLLHRFLAGVTTIIALTIVSAMMCGVLVIGGFYGIYSLLVMYGLQSGIAMWVVAALVVMLTAGLVGLTFYKFNELRSLPAAMTRPDLGPLSKIGDIASAFIEGFNKARNS